MYLSAKRAIQYHMLWCLEPGTLSMSISLVFIPSSGFSCVQIFASLWTLACQAPLSMEFSRQEYWNGLPCPPPGDLPDPGIELTSLTSPAGRFFTTSATQEALSSVQFSRSVVSDSLRPHEPQHTRPPCPSPSPRAYPNSCLLSQ